MEPGKTKEIEAIMILLRINILNPLSMLLSLGERIKDGVYSAC